MTNEKTNAPMASRGLQILVVEDESLVAMMIEDMLTDLGHEVVATSGRMPDASKLVSDASADLAILDVNLNGEETYPLADSLAQETFLSSSPRVTARPESRPNGRACQFFRSRSSLASSPKQSILQYENDHCRAILAGADRSIETAMASAAAGR
jgi:CheY-like chemotaxis protein